MLLHGNNVFNFLDVIILQLSIIVLGSLFSDKFIE